jgi:hypothetical protein
MTIKLILKSDELSTDTEQPTDQNAGEVQQQKEPQQKLLTKPPIQVSLNMRRGLDGRLLIYDHEHIDIVFVPDKMKVIAFAKKDYSDIIYETQNRLFKFLAERGLCSPHGVRGGSVYGALECRMFFPKDEIPMEHILVLNIKKWLDSEIPSIEKEKEYIDNFEKFLTDPDDEDSTQLGEVPQESFKGSIPQYASRRYIGGWW